MSAHGPTGRGIKGVVHAPTRRRSTGTVQGLFVEESAIWLGRLLVESRSSPALLAKHLSPEDRRRLLGGPASTAIALADLERRLDALLWLHPGDPESIWMALGAEAAQRWLHARGRTSVEPERSAERLGELLNAAFSSQDGAAAFHTRCRSEDRMLTWCPGTTIPIAVFHAARGAAGLALGSTEHRLLAVQSAAERIELHWKPRCSRVMAH